MKKILALLFSLNALALSSSGKVNQVKYLEGNLPFINYVKNPSCTKNATTGLTAVSTVLSRDTNGAINEVSDCSFTLNAASDSVDWALNALDEGLYGQNCEARISYKFDNQNVGQTFYFRVKNGSDTVAQVEIPNTKGTPSINVPCGDGTQTYSVQVIQTAGSSAQVVHVADVYFGRATNVGSVAQASLVGTINWAGATNCVWTASSAGSGAFADFTADNDCNNPTVTGDLVAPGTKVPQFTINNMPAGKYLIVVNGMFDINGAQSDWRITDGTNNFYSGAQNTGAATSFNTLNATAEYSSADSRTFKIQANSVGSAVDLKINNERTYRYLTISVYRFPTSSEIAYRPEQLINTSTLKYAGTTNCIWETTSASFAAFAADTDCPTPTVTGNASAPGTKIPGVTISSLPAGKYMVVTQANLYGTVAADQCRYELYDGTNSSGFVPIYTSAGVANNNGTIVGVFSYTALQSNLTFQVRALRSSGSGNCQIRVNDSTESFQISVIPLDKNGNTPLLVGSVTSNSTGAERIERVSVDCDASSGVLSQSGSWISSVGNRATNCQVNIASGIFSSAPTCVCSSRGDGSNSWCQAFGATTSLFRVQFMSSSATDVDGEGDIICMGPR